MLVVNVFMFIMVPWCSHSFSVVQSNANMGYCILSPFASPSFTFQLYTHELHITYTTRVRCVFQTNTIMHWSVSGFTNQFMNHVIRDPLGQEMAYSDSVVFFHLSLVYSQWQIYMSNFTALKLLWGIQFLEILLCEN